MFSIQAYVVFVAFSILQEDNRAVSFDSLDGFNHWAMKFQIETSEDLQRRLGVTVQQLKAINELRFDKYRPKFSAKRDSGRQFSGDRYVSVDAEVKADLAKILDDSQMSRLRPIALRLTFRDPVSAFESVEVADYLRGTESMRKSLHEIVDSCNKNYFTNIMTIRNQSAKAIVDSMDTSTKVLFANLAGNKYCTNISVEPLIAFDSVPFQKSIKSGSTVYLLTSESGFGRSQGLTPSQIQQMDLAEKTISGILAGKLNGEPVRFDERLTVAQLVAVKTLESTLSPEQLISVARRLMGERFCANPAKVFEDRNVMKYLGLIGDDAAALEMTIAEESKKLELAVAELNRRTFFQLCALLPPDKEKDMIRIFQGVWDEM